MKITIWSFPDRQAQGKTTHVKHTDNARKDPNGTKQLWQNRAVVTSVFLTSQEAFRDLAQHWTKWG